MNFLLLKEQWLKIKTDGKKSYTLKMFKILTLTIVLCAGIFNAAMISRGNIDMNIYKYILTFLVIPLIISIIYTYIVVASTWKINTIAYELKEKDPKVYKKNVIASTVLNLMTILALVTFSPEKLFLKTGKEFLQSLLSSAVAGILIGVVFGLFLWKKVYERAVK